MDVLRFSPGQADLPEAGAQMQPVFYYDLGDPACYFAAEQAVAGLPTVPEWEPVLAAEVGALGPEASRRDEVERRAAALALQPFRWPEAWPPDSREAMLAATFAKRIGRTVAFSLAAFRQAFAAGRDLGDPDTILIAGAACEIHPAALLRAIGTRSTTTALAQACTRARAAGVRSLPAIQVGPEVFEGEDLIQAAAAALGPGPRRP